MNQAAPRWAPDALADRKRSVEKVGRRTLERAIRSRHMHRGFMAEYRRARLLVERVRQTGDGPLFASWF